MRAWSTNTRTILIVIGLAAGCGARTSLVVDLETDEESSAASSGDAGPAERSCLPNCTVGHQCCIGGCGGPPAVTENGCCACLPGEVNSQQCDNGQCE